MNVALVFAGGTGRRMGKTGVPKQFLEIYGRPVIVHTLEQFEKHPQIDAILVAILPEYHSQFESMVRQYNLKKVKWIVDGGVTGQESRFKGLHTLVKCCPKNSIVLIHDGVRPLISSSLITSTINDVIKYGSAIVSTKVKETVISCLDGDTVAEVLPRETLWTAQAPQAFHLDQIFRVYEQAIQSGESDSVDSCTLFKKYGFTPHMVPGPEENIKITTISDYYLVRSYLTLAEDRLAFGEVADQ